MVPPPLLLLTRRHCLTPHAGRPPLHPMAVRCVAVAMASKLPLRLPWLAITARPGLP